MDQTTNHEGRILSAPWQRLLAEYGIRYRRTTGTDLDVPLVEIVDGLPLPRSFDQRVLDGFARKAAVAMMHICTVCGGGGRRRVLQEEKTVLCASCFGKQKLREEIFALLEDVEESGCKYTHNSRVAWHEHDLSPRICSAIPSFVWRQTDVPSMGVVRYIGREDLEILSAWFRKLASLLEATVEKHERPALPS